MATAYSSNLALALPVTGELSGTWGTTVNTQITNMLDEALGYQAFTATGGADTLTIPDGTTGVARSIYIQLNGTGGGSVAVPTAKTKMYFVFNNTSSAITFKVTGQTGVSIPAAGKMALVSNGTDIIVAQNYFSALTLGAALPVASGGTGITSFGTGVATALGVNTGTAGAFVVNGGALGSPSTAGTMPAFTLGGTVSGGGNQINNVIIGTTSPLAGAFSTLSATSNLTVAQKITTTSTSNDWTNIVIGNTTSGQSYGTRIQAGTTAGDYSFLVKNSTNATEYFSILGNGAAAFGNGLAVTGALSATGTLSGGTSGTGYSFSGSAAAGSLALTSGGDVGIGTASPISKLQVVGTTNSGYATSNAITNGGSAISNSSALASGSSLRLTANFGGAVAFTGRASELVFGADNGNFGGGGGFPQGNLGAITAVSETGNAATLAASMLFYTTAGNNINERMRLDSSGNLGLGVTPSAWTTVTPVLQIKNTALSAYSGIQASYVSNGYYNAGWKYIQTGNATLYSHNEVAGGIHAWFTAPSGTAGNAISFTQAMTLDASGNLLVGTTSGTSYKLALQTSAASQSAIGTAGTSGDTTYQAILVTKFDNDSTTSQNFIQFQINNGGANCGKITANGANTAAFGSTSDQRVKENIAELPSQLANIMALRPVEFDYLESYGGGHQVGFIAQEMQQVYPDVISTDDSSEKIMSITGWSKTEARLVKAIQEQQALITQLTARITALETA